MSSAVESPSSPSPSSSFDSSTDETHPQDLTKIRIKTEDGTDEVKVFSASTDLNKEIDADVDVDGIEDRLSPVVEEPTSPTKTEPTVGNLYPPAFLYPYFHPMWNPYLMAAAAQAQTPGVSSEKLSADPFPAAPPGPFGGVPFPGLYPPNMANPSFQPNLFNPFGIPIPTPGLRPSGASSMSDRPSGKDLNSLLESKRPRKPHIKKPLNAFMIYMKEQRAKVIEECTLKESSAINKVLGQKWKELSRAEQDRYYELAKEERNRHMQMYPGWSARDNYGLKKKRSSISHPEHPQKKFIRENHPASPLKALPKPSHLYENDCAAQKKCRARYGLEGLNQWCKHCRRKKKCTRFLEEDSNGTYQNNPMANPSSVNSPGPSENDESINDLDSDDILARQIDSIDDDDEQENSDEENQHHPRAQQFYPGFSY